MRIDLPAGFADVLASPLFFCVALLAAAAVFLLLGIKIGQALSAARFHRRVKSERADAVKRSRAVLRGQMAEQVSPWLPGFPADPEDARFIGKPVDFVAFCGASSGRVSEVLFIEVKSGGSRLSPVEASLREAVDAGRVRYAEYRVPD